MTGTTFIDELATQCRIGCDTKEREAWQPILIDIDCDVNLEAAVASDQRRDCVDYCALQEIALRLAKTTTYRLLERLAYEIALEVLKLPNVVAVLVEICKPHKLPGCKSVGISITMSRDEVKHV